MAEQYWGGAVGALVTEDPTDALAGYETHIMILKDISLSAGRPEPHTMMMDYMHGKEGSIVTVNGLVNPVLQARPGQVQRWRVLNASNARFYKLSLQGHDIHLIGTDGGLLDHPYAMPYLLLSPGERADLLVRVSDTPGSYQLLALPYARRGMMSSTQVTLLTMASSGSPLVQSLPAVVNPDAMRPMIDPMMYPHRQLTLSMMMGRGYINGQDFDVDPYTIMSELGMGEIWEIINDSGMDHPFHQHVNPALVLSVTGGDAAYASTYTSIPGWKDTVVIPKWGSATLFIPVEDYPGMTMFHCHILEHEDIGMMGMWHIMGMMTGAEPPVTAGGLRLSAPYPNPSGSSARMLLSASPDARVELSAFDVAGRRLEGIVTEGGARDGGREILVNTDGLARGLYFVRAASEGKSVTRRMVVLGER